MGVKRFLTKILGFNVTSEFTLPAPSGARISVLVDSANFYREVAKVGGGIVRRELRNEKKRMEKGEENSEAAKKIKTDPFVSFVLAAGSEVLHEDADMCNDDPFVLEIAFRRVLTVMRRDLGIDLIFARDAPRGIDGAQSYRDVVWNQRHEQNTSMTSQAYLYSAGHSRSKLPPHEDLIQSSYASKLFYDIIEEVNGDTTMAGIPPIRVIQLDTEVDAMLGTLVHAFDVDYIITNDTDFFVTPILSPPKGKANGKNSFVGILISSQLPIEEILRYCPHGTPKVHRFATSNVPFTPCSIERLFEVFQLNAASVPVTPLSLNSNTQTVIDWLNGDCNVMALAGTLCGNDMTSSSRAVATRVSCGYTKLDEIESIVKHGDEPPSLDLPSVVEDDLDNDEDCSCPLFGDIVGCVEFLLKMRELSVSAPKAIAEMVLFLVQPASVQRSLEQYAESAQTTPKDPKAAAAIAEYKEQMRRGQVSATTQMTYGMNYKLRYIMGDQVDFPTGTVVPKKETVIANKPELKVFIDLYCTGLQMGHSMMPLLLYDLIVEASTTFRASDGCLLPPWESLKTVQYFISVMRVLLQRQLEHCYNRGGSKVTWYSLFQHPANIKRRVFESLFMAPHKTAKKRATELKAVSVADVSGCLDSIVSEVLAAGDCGGTSSKFVFHHCVLWLIHPTLYADELPFLAQLLALMHLRRTNRPEWQRVVTALGECVGTDFDERPVPRVLEISLQLNRAYELVRQILSLFGGSEAIIDIPTAADFYSGSIHHLLYLANRQEKGKTSTNLSSGTKKAEQASITSILESCSVYQEAKRLRDIVKASADAWGATEVAGTKEVELQTVKTGRVQGVVGSAQRLQEAVAVASCSTSVTIGYGLLPGDSPFISRQDASWVGILHKDEYVDAIDPGEATFTEGGELVMKTGKARGATFKSVNPSGDENNQTKKAPPLPILSHMDKLLERVRNNKIVCLQGETGCGKSSMIPLHIYLDAVYRKEYVSIVVTQPRRIAATSVARHVARILGEEVGNTVGYRIGGGKEFHKESSNTCIRFVTTGYLMEALIGGNKLKDQLTHIILDEVHERSLQVDLLSLIVKFTIRDENIVKAARSNGRDHMTNKYSADMAQELRNRVNKAAVQVMPQLTGDDDNDDEDIEDEHPVLCHADGDNDDTYGIAQRHQAVRRELENAHRMKHGLSKPMTSVEAANDLVSERLTLPPPPDSVRLVIMSATIQADMFCKYFEPVLPQGQGKIPNEFVGAHRCKVTDYYLDDWLNKFQNKLPSDIVGRLRSYKSLIEKAEAGNKSIRFIKDEGHIVVADATLSCMEKGSCILVFLPGLEEIENVQEAIRAAMNRFSGGGVNLRLHILHSTVPTEEQNKIVEESKEDECKVILATNIAETSLTIPSVKTVIDCGLARRMGYDARRGIRTLQCTWCSQSSLKQRSGRAGRVTDGTVLHLYLRSTVDKLMPPFDPSDLMPLENSVLQIQNYLNAFGTISEVMQEMIDPPDPNEVENACERLVRWGALSPGPDYKVLPLGNAALRLPVDISLTKALLLSIPLGCVAETIVVASGLTAERSMFINPLRVFYSSDQEYLTNLSYVSRGLSHFERQRGCDVSVFLSIYEELVHLTFTERGRLRDMYSLALRSVATFVKYCKQLASSVLKLGAELLPEDMARLEKIRDEGQVAFPALRDGTKYLLFQSVLSSCSSLVISSTKKAATSKKGNARKEYSTYDVYLFKVCEDNGLEEEFLSRTVLLPSFNFPLEVATSAKEGLAPFSCKDKKRKKNSRKEPENWEDDLEDDNDEQDNVLASPPLSSSAKTLHLDVLERTLETALQLPRNSCRVSCMLNKQIVITFGVDELIELLRQKGVTVTFNSRIGTVEATKSGPSTITFVKNKSGAVEQRCNNEEQLSREGRGAKEVVVGVPTLKTLQDALAHLYFPEHYAIRAMRMLRSRHPCRRQILPVVPVGTGSTLPTAEGVDPGWVLCDDLAFYQSIPTRRTFLFNYSPADGIAAFETRDRVLLGYWSALDSPRLVTMNILTTGNIERTTQVREWGAEGVKCILRTAAENAPSMGILAFGLQENGNSLMCSNATPITGSTIDQICAVCLSSGCTEILQTNVGMVAGVSLSITAKFVTAKQLGVCRLVSHYVTGVSIGPIGVDAALAKKGNVEFVSTSLQYSPVSATLATHNLLPLLFIQLMIYLSQSHSDYTEEKKKLLSLITDARELALAGASGTLSSTAASTAAAVATLGRGCGVAPIGSSPSGIIRTEDGKGEALHKYSNFSSGSREEIVNERVCIPTTEVVTFQRIRCLLFDLEKLYNEIRKLREYTDDDVPSDESYEWDHPSEDEEDRARRHEQEKKEKSNPHWYKAMLPPPHAALYEKYLDIINTIQAPSNSDRDRNDNCQSRRGNHNNAHGGNKNKNSEDEYNKEGRGRGGSSDKGRGRGRPDKDNTNDSKNKQRGRGRGRGNHVDSSPVPTSTEPKAETSRGRGGRGGGSRGRRRRH